MHQVARYKQAAHPVDGMSGHMSGRGHGLYAERQTVGICKTVYLIAVFAYCHDGIPGVLRAHRQPTVILLFGNIQLGTCKHGLACACKPSYVVAVKVGDDYVVDVAGRQTELFKTFQHHSAAGLAVARIKHYPLAFGLDDEAAYRRRHRTFWREALYLCRIFRAVKQLVGHTLVAVVVLDCYHFHVVYGLRLHTFGLRCVVDLRLPAGVTA